jgi:hypothetical protein
MFSELTILKLLLKDSHSSYDNYIQLNIDITRLTRDSLTGYETFSVALRDRHRLRVFENRLLRRIFVLKKDEILEIRLKIE